MTNHHDDLRVAPDPEQAEQLRRRLHARLARGHRDELGHFPATLRSDVADADLREGDILMLETEDRSTQRDPMASPDRRPPRRWLLAAAAAVLVAVLGTAVVLAGDDDEPVDTITPPPTAADAPGPTDVMAVPGRANGFPALEPGRYDVDPDGDPTTPLRVTYEVAADGWKAWFGAVRFSEPSAAIVSITTVTNLVSDGCGEAPLDPPVGPSVDDLATALTQMPPFVVSAPPTDVTFLGYQGMHLELTVPEAGASACSANDLHSWFSPVNGDAAFGGYDIPGETEEFWILDVEGTRLVLVKTGSSFLSEEVAAERDAIFDSIRIEP